MKRSKKKLEVDLLISEKPKLKNYEHIPSIAVD